MILWYIVALYSSKMGDRAACQSSHKRCCDNVAYLVMWEIHQLTQSPVRLKHIATDAVIEWSRDKNIISSFTNKTNRFNWNYLKCKLFIFYGQKGLSRN